MKCYVKCKKKEGCEVQFKINNWACVFFIALDAIFKTRKDMVFTVQSMYDA